MMTLGRVSLLVFVWLAILAPTPGSVGACGGDEFDDPADFTSYCQTREELTCVRRYLRREITSADRDECRFQAAPTCERRSFPHDCVPNQRTARTCLNALSSFATIETPESELPECNTSALCVGLGVAGSEGALEP